MGLLATSGCMPVFGIDGTAEIAAAIADAAYAAGIVARATVAVVAILGVGAAEAIAVPGGVANPVLVGGMSVDGDTAPACGFNPPAAACVGGGLGNDIGGIFMLVGRPAMFGRLLCGAKLVFMPLNICASWSILRANCSLVACCRRRSCCCSCCC